MLLRLLKIFTNFGGDFFCSFQYMAMDSMTMQKMKRHYLFGYLLVFVLTGMHKSSIHNKQIEKGKKKQH